MLTIVICSQIVFLNFPILNTICELIRILYINNILVLIQIKYLSECSPDFNGENEFVYWNLKDKEKKKYLTC
jgi:hypothetical protein